jgi:hypothetical protein
MKVQMNTEVEVPSGVARQTVRQAVTDAMHDLADSQGVPVAFLDVLVDDEVDIASASLFPSPSVEVRDAPGMYDEPDEGLAVGYTEGDRTEDPEPYLSDDKDTETAVDSTIGYSEYSARRDALEIAMRCPGVESPEQALKHAKSFQDFLFARS